VIPLPLHSPTDLAASRTLLTYLLTYLLTTTYYSLPGLDHNYCRNHPNISSFAFESISSSDVSYPTGIIGIQQTAYNQTRDAP